MSNLVFVPVPEFGHIIPPLKLAKALRARGHQVHYAGMPDFEEYVRSQGIEYLCMFRDRYPKGYLKQRATKQAKLKLDNLSLMLLEAKDNNEAIALDPLGAFLGEISRVADICHPDLFLVDNMLRQLAAEMVRKLELPTIRLSLHFEEALIGLGDLQDDSPGRNLPTLVLCPKEIDFSCSSVKDNYFYLEPSIELNREDGCDFPWHELDRSRALIYCSFGSQCHQYDQTPRLFRAIIDAMRQKTDHQLVLAIGPHLRATEFEPLPSNVLLVNWAPQLQILQRASMMITHGGLGAVKECIFFGVPMIVFPGNWDQPNHAARVVHHGIGVRGNIHDRSAEQVVSLIDAISSTPSFKRRIDAMSEVFRQIEGSGIGVRTVEKLVSAWGIKRPLTRDRCDTNISSTKLY